MEKITEDDLKNLVMKKEDEEKPSDKVKDEETIKEELKEKLKFPTYDEMLEMEKELGTMNFDKIPDVSDLTLVNEGNDEELDPLLKERKELSVGITPEDIKELYEYISGKADKPLFLDKFTADVEGRLKDMTLVMHLLQLSRIPVLTALQTQIHERLYAPENLYNMEIKDLTSAEKNINAEINNTLSSALKSIDLLNQFGTLSNDYRDLINTILLLPKDKLERIKEIVYTIE